MHKSSKYRAVNILYFIGLLAVVLPLLILGHFDYPSADDWTFGQVGYKVIQNNGSIFDVFKAICHTVSLCWVSGEPRFTNALFGCLQPGIWGEHFYRITPWLMLGSLCISEICLCAYLLRDNEKQNKYMVFPILIPSLLLQILCVPDSSQGFFWYVGAVNYTFVFGLANFLVILFLMLAREKMSRGKSAAVMLAAVILAVMVGGNNYATSLSTACLLVLISVLLCIQRKPGFWKTLPVTAAMVASILICVTAPANQVRLDSEFGGTTYSPIRAIVMALVRTATNIYSWTTVKIILMLLLVLPFLWKATRRLAYSFKYPFLFTLVSFGIYASQIVATMYVDGSTGGGRMSDILYYAYHMWIMLNTGYWIGWLQRKFRFEKVRGWSRMCGFIGTHLTGWVLTAGILLAAFLGINELASLSSYRACAWLVKGYAEEYADAWEERLEVLHDPSVDTVYFEPLSQYTELIFYADLEQGEKWVNEACADYYGKEYVGLKTGD
ncbi:MAG: DUF6056 family protein [Acetatifactor sp.]